MGSNIVVDDTDTHIAYAGSSDWAVLMGSSRQWGSTVHSTRTYGATASFRFFGTSFIMYGTVPAGSGTVYVDITVDGGTPISVTRTSGSNYVYADVFYQSPTLQDDFVHTVVFTNRGHSTDSSFQFDSVQLLSLSGDPSITSPPNLPNATPTTQTAVVGTTAIIGTTIIDGTTKLDGTTIISYGTTIIDGTTTRISSTTSSPSLSSSSAGLAGSHISSLDSTSSGRSVNSLGQPVTLTQQLTKTGQPDSTSTSLINTPGTQANDRQVHLSVGAMVGVAIGGLVILALFVAGCFALKRRRSFSPSQTQRSIYIPTPFGAEPHPRTISTTALMEKASTHPTSVTRPDLETRLPNLHATDTFATDLNIGQQESYGSQQDTLGAPPAYQAKRGSAAGARTSILTLFSAIPGGSGIA